MKRVALIESGVSGPKKFVYQVYPPHGLMYLASWLRSKNPEVEIRIIDLMLRREPEESILAELKKFSPDLVGIHAMHFQANSMHKLAALVKQNCNARVAVGGPYPSSEPRRALADPNIDLAVRGEGEITFAEIVARLDSGKDFSGVAGCAYRRDGQVVLEPERPFIDDLDQVPFPAWDLIDLKKFFDWNILTQNDIRMRKEIATIFMSRACPYGCIFCHNMFGKRFRGRSPENVIQEIKLLHDKFGVREIHIIDDCFNFEIPRAKKILSLIIDSGMDLKLAFPNGIRGDRLDEELIDLLKQAGTYKVNLGIESGSERIQQMIHKGLDLKKIKNNIELAASAGIFTHGFFMIGFPGETEDDIQKTIDFAAESRLHTAGFALLSPFPGTRVAEIAEAMGKKCGFDPEDTSYARIACNLTEISDSRLAALHRKAHWKFYFRPGQAFRILSAMPNKWMLPRIFWAHFRLKFL
jgi:radical SAM superfamily enzyme YgiQ (UPF0313 family)